ncbi:MAG: hypothetical protein IPI32_14235 [Austwickia sp.]|nr:hypothetical protein [Austwickia sp.]MBK8435387.1 hypothetical protein [Austwickia sp.]MBK9101066.1 hypothetical protein [Austwickia sp.]
MLATAYVLSMVSGRLLVLPENGIAAVWPAVGVAYLWLLPFATNGERARRMWPLLTVIVSVNALVNGVTGMAWGWAWIAGVCNALAAQVACVLHTRSRIIGGEELFTARRLRVLIGHVLIATAISGLTFPLAALAGGFLSVSDVGFWFLRNASALLLFAIGPAVLRPTSHPKAPGVGTLWVAFLTLATIAAMTLAALTSGGALLAFAVVLVGIWSATVFTAPEIYAYLMSVAATVSGMTVLGYSPFGGQASASRVAVVQAVMAITVTVAVALALDRQERLVLLAQIEHERAEIARQALLLAQQSRLLGTIVGTMGEGVLVLDSSGRILLRNRSASDLVGITDGEDMSAGVLAPGQPGAVATGDIRVGGPDGPSRIVAVRAHAIEYPHAARVVILHDVTEDRHHISELESFARAAAHDLRQPLTVIQLWMETLRASLEDEAEPAGTSRQYDERDEHALRMDAVGRIDAAAERMALFLSDLLGYTVVRDGQPVPQPVDVGELVDEVLRGWATAAVDPPPKVSIQAETPVHADPSLMRRLLDNLVGNALKYTRPGEPAQVMVSTVPDGDGVILRIDDRGVGVPAGQEERIFDEFHRAPQHAQEYPGTGLGLALCRRIAERHDGWIRAAQRDGGGTRVEVRLPAVPTEVAAAAQPRRSRAATAHRAR